jgi:putative membrane protein
VSSTFFADEARRRIVEAVQAVESKSSAEIVVSVRTRSDDYREVDLVAGVLLAIATLAVLIYHPAELDENFMPIETLAAFAVGSVLVNKLPGLKRVLTPGKKKRARTLAAARAHFVEAGISRTRDRSGILVFVSELERAVCVVPDIGIDESRLGDAWKSRLAELETAGSSLEPAAFATALSALAPVLGAMYPRRDDDVNELADAPLVEATR